MTTSEVSAREYSAIFGPMFSHVYNSVAFAELNSAKADAIRYLSIVDNKPRCGIIFGERQGRLISGFSAPFGGFENNTAARFVINYGKIANGISFRRI